MNTSTNTRISETTTTPAPAPQRPVPVLLQWGYTAFMAVLIPVYWSQYGPTNFLYFCDVALFLTLAGVWLNSRRLISIAAVGIIIPQFFWCLDFLIQCTGHRFTGMTAYMFDARRSLFLRGLSFFHGWLPWMLLFLVRRIGYDRRALGLWTLTAWALCLVCYFLMPGAGAQVADSKTPRNINYVFGFDDDAPQSWMPGPVFLLVWMTALPTFLYVPAHWFLCRWSSRLSNVGESLRAVQNPGRIQ